MQNFVSIIRRLEQSFVRAKLEPYGMQPFEGLILHFISCHELCNQDTICSNTEMDKGRVAKAMAHLEKNEFICRVINENNKREKLVRLTERGQVMVTIFNGILDEWKGICYVGFSDEERECYLGFLKRISNNVLANRKGEKENG